MRDDFDNNTKDILAKRVGYRCSNPNCRKLTAGPQEDSSKAINIGVAAHITAASKKGPRFDANLTPIERKSIDNGIWLCQNCAKLIDNDEIRYNQDLLLRWKELSESAALLEIDGKSPNGDKLITDDIEIIKFFSQCFDRPAFQDPFNNEYSMEAFDKAIEDTITAINTGTLRARDGTILSKAKGKSFLNNPDWRRKMDLIVDLLRVIRSRFLIAIQMGQIHTGHERNGIQFYFIRDNSIIIWMDETRHEIINLFSEICIEAGIPTLLFPRFPRMRY